MLSFARALALDPSLLLDEPLEGLATIIVEELLCPMALVVQEEGLAAIIVEQNPHNHPAHHSARHGARAWHHRA